MSKFFYNIRKKIVRIKVLEKHKENDEEENKLEIINLNKRIKDLELERNNYKIEASNKKKEKRKNNLLGI